MFLSTFNSWLQEPFRTNMSALRWVAFVGLLIAISAFWSIVLSHLREI